MSTKYLIPKDNSAIHSPRYKHDVAPRKIAVKCNSHHHQGVIVPSAKSVCIQIGLTRHLHLNRTHNTTQKAREGVRWFAFPPKADGSLLTRGSARNHGAQRSYTAIFSTPPNLWTDSNRNNVGDDLPGVPNNSAQTGRRGRRPLQIKIYLQSHRCNGSLDRFGLTKYLKSLQNSGIIVRKERW